MSDWAPFFSEAERARFLALLEQVLEQFPGARIDDAVVHLNAESKVALSALAQSCRKQSDSLDWKAALEGQLQQTLDAHREFGASSASDFGTIKAQLRVRVYTHEALATLPADLLRRNIGADLDQVLVLDMPKGIASVTPARRAAWEVDDDTLFATARANLAQFEAATVEEIDLAPDTPGRALVGESYFTASHLLDVARYVDPPERGLLVGVPHRHVVLLHRIEDASVAEAIEAMIAMTRGMHAEGPGSISDQIYWWRDGRLTLLRWELRDGGIVFLPPERFITAVLRPLLG